MIKQALIKRFQYLWTWELVDSFLLPAMFFTGSIFIDHTIGLLTIYGSACLALFLWQGVAWWRLNLAAVRQCSPIPSERLRPFRAWKIINWVILAALPLVIWLRFFVIGPAWLNYDVAGGAFLYLLAFLEQINYYYYQLMYDNRSDLAWLLRARRLKVAGLKRALDHLPESA